MRKIVVFILSLWVLSTVLYLPSAVGGDPVKEDKSITFQPNVIPFLNVTSQVGKHDESFRFEWLGNRFDIELFFNATYKGEIRLFSLRDFEVDFNVTVEYIINKNESHCQFGWIINNVENISSFVHNAWFKIEDTKPFDYDEIEVESIEVDVNETFTQLRLPDNLLLSFDDLKDKGFTIGWQNKTSTSVKGFSNKSSWNLDPVTYSGGVITILGYSEGSECDADDIVSGVANTSVFAKHDDLQYSCDAVIVIGNDTYPSWVAFENIQLAFNSTCISSNWENPLIKVEDEGHLRLGTLISSDNKRTENGVSILDNEDNSHLLISSDRYSEVNLYSSYFWSVLGAIIEITCDSTYNSQIYECIFDQTYLSSGVTYVNCDIYRITQKKTQYGFRYFSATIDDAYFHTDSYALYWHGIYGPYIVENLKVRNCTYLVRTYNLGAYGEGDNYLINPDVDSWTFSWGTAHTGKIFRQYTFDLTVTYPNGTGIQNANVTVKHYGQGETQDFTELTDSNGQISTKTLSMGFYNQTGGDTIYSYNPYHIEITNVTGYEIYNGNFSLHEKTNWEICLCPESYSWFGVTIIIGLLSCFMLVIVLTAKK